MCDIWKTPLNVTVAEFWKTAEKNIRIPSKANYRFEQNDVLIIIYSDISPLRMYLKITCLSLAFRKDHIQYGGS